MKETIIVAISGPSSSGKTTVTKNLLHLLNCQILHQDDFYVPDDQIPIDPIKNEQNWDHPDAIDFNKFKRHIRDIKNGKTLPPVESLELEVDMKLTDEEIAVLKHKLPNRLNDYNIVLIDGFMLYHDEELVSLFDLKLFYYSSYDVLKLRRSKRVGYSTVAGFWVDPPNYFDDYVWPAYVAYHKQLFEKEDVNGTLNEYGEELGIRGFRNDDSSSVGEMVEWSIDRVIEYEENKD